MKIQYAVSQSLSLIPTSTSCHIIIIYLSVLALACKNTVSNAQSVTNLTHQLPRLTWKDPAIHAIASSTNQHAQHKRNWCLRAVCWQRLVVKGNDTNYPFTLIVRAAGDLYASVMLFWTDHLQHRKVLQELNGASFSSSLEEKSLFVMARNWKGCQVLKRKWDLHLQQLHQGNLERNRGNGQLKSIK